MCFPVKNESMAGLQDSRRGSNSNKSVKIESFGNRSLWQLINGTGVLRPNELVKIELERNEKKILEGLSFYKKPVTVAGEEIKDKKLSKSQKDLILKISGFLGLNETQSYELFLSFLANDYRGSQKSLQHLLGNERHTQALVYKIRDYYYTERLYLLQCFKVIINFWQDDMHAFKNELEEFMNKVNVTDGIILDKLLDQLKQCLAFSLPSWQTHGILMTERQALVWAHQNLKEQCELLEILMIYLKDFEIDTDKVIQFMEMFKRHGFGKHQTYKHILEEPAEPFVRRIGYLELLIMLESLDLETVFGCTQLGQFDDHFILKDEDNFARLDKVMATLGTDPAHGPILLCWAGIRMMYPPARDDINMTRKFGNTALQLSVFSTLYDVLNTEPFCGKTSFVSSVAHYILYTLFVNIMTAFDENTLARRREEIEVLHMILCQILKQDFAAEDFWQKGLEEGLGSVVQSSLLKFPLDFDSLVKFSTALASSNQESAERILGIWKNLQYYTEYLDRNSSSDLNFTKDPSIWQLARNKIPYHGGRFKIDAGTCGQLLSNNGKDEESPIIQWEVSYDGWELLSCEIESLLQQISYGAGSVSPVQVSKVTTTIELVCAILSSYPQVLDQFQNITEMLYQLIHRFATYNYPPLELISSCIQCLTCVAKKYPDQVWHKMKQTGLLPYLTEHVDNVAEVLSGQGLSAGSYGSLLAGYECTRGRYPVTTAFLDFISIFIQPFFKGDREGDLMAPILYFLREVFPVFQKWRYYNSVKREVIGQRCLEIFHRILTYLTGDKKKSDRPQLQEICVYSLLFTEAGRSLLELIATGADTIEMALAQQGSIVEHGTGAEMIQLVQLSFSVLNRLLLLKSPDLPLSPVESALSSQPAGRQTQHIVATISAYIYHRHNPRLPTLACLLLKRLALVSRMSILACLGGDAECIRNTYITRLQAVTEDLQLKVNILQLLSVCVEAQPGLIETFLNVQPAETSDLSASTSSKKDLSLGKTSCLQTVLDLMEAKKQGDYLCPPDLLCACLDFIHSLWSGLRDTAMSVLRARSNFWLSVCAPLTRDLPPLGDLSEEFKVVLPYQLKTIAFVLRILSEETYTVTSSKLDAELKKVLSNVSANNRWKYWSAYIKDCLITEGENTDTDSTSESQAENPTLQLLVAWKHFIVTAARLKVEELNLTNSLKEAVIVDLMEGLQALVSGDNTPLNVKMAQISSALLFTLIKLWTSALSNQARMIKELESAVTQTLSNSKTLVPPIQIGLLGSITIILQHSRMNSSINIGKETMATVLNTTCTVLLQSTRQLPSHTDINRTQLKDTQSTDVKLKLQMVTSCLLEELLLQSSRCETWLSVLQENFTLPTLLASVEGFIKGKRGVQYVHTVFLLMLTIAKTTKGAEALALSGLTQYTCLSMISLYQDADFFSQLPIPVPQRQNEKDVEECKLVSWHRVYCLCIDLFATVLRALKYSFLEDALHFVGAHQDRMQQCLEISRISMCGNALHEAEKTCDFIHQLSHYIREWRLHLPESLVKLQTSMIYMSQSFIAFLMRPRYLQHIIEQQQGQKSQSKARSSLSPKQPKLQQQSSLEDIDKPSTALIKTQHRMLAILGRSLSSLRQFTPDLCEILHEQSMDYSEYEPFLALGFTAPAVDQDSLPSFGTLTSCVRDVCIRLLTKLDARSSPSPHKSPDPNTSRVIPKTLVLYVMENALYIIMSQATRYLRDPGLPTSDKQLLKRELGTELNYFLMELQRYLRRGAAPSSPVTTQRSLSPHTSAGGAVLGRSISQSAFTASQDTEFFKFVQEFVGQVLK